MKLIKYITLIAAMALAMACSVVEKDPTEIRAGINNQIEAENNADASPRFVWRDGDCISIFDRNTCNVKYRYNGKSGDVSGSFKIVPGDDSSNSEKLDRIYAVYPYSIGNSLTNSGVLSVPLPSS